MHEATAERIAAAGGIDNPCLHGGFVAVAFGPAAPSGAAFAGRDDDVVDRTDGTVRELAQRFVLELVDDDREPM